MKTELRPQLESTITALIAPGKGILAADESFPTIEKRFKSINIPSTEESRRAYREMLFTTPSKILENNFMPTSLQIENRGTAVPP